MQFPPGLQPPPGSPSHGSLAHMRGDCSPCAFFWKPRGCQNGPQCHYCHLCPEGEVKNRKKMKQARMRLGLVTPVTSTAVPTSPTQDVDVFGFNCVQEKFTCSSNITSDSETTHYSDSDQDSTGPSSEQELVFNSEQDELSQSAKPLMTPSNTSVVQPPGLESPSFGMLNPGSTLHDCGACTPCAWFWKTSGCQNNVDCRFCHICPDGELKARKKSKRDLMRSFRGAQSQILEL